VSGIHVIQTRRSRSFVTSRHGHSSASPLPHIMPSQPSSTPGASSQSSLYQFYSPLPASSPSAQPRRILQPSTQHNIAVLSSPERRIHLKRPHPQKSAPTKKAKPSSPKKTVDVAHTFPEGLPVRRIVRQTVGRSLIARGLGQRSSLQQCM
jgi:hypothetical protein